MTSALFWERLQATGVASPEVCRQWSKEIEAGLGKENTADPLKIASALLRSGKLTPFQLNCISESHPPLLMVGPYRLVETLSDRLGPNWFDAVNATQNTQKWCFQLRPNQLCAAEVKKWPPSVELAGIHREVESPFLDKWESVIAGQGSLSCFCEPVPGAPLSKRLDDGPLTVEESFRIVSQLAQSLHDLHTAKLVHGNLSAHQCWDDGKTCTLRRNILFVPRSPYSLTEDLFIRDSEQHRWMGAAPEFALPEAKPSPQTDLYSLGILWLHLLNGESAWNRIGSLDALGWKKVHAQEVPEIPASLPALQQSMLKSLLAKNPSMRCKSAKSLLQRLSLPVDLKAKANVTKVASSEDATKDKGSVSVDTNRSADKTNADKIAESQPIEKTSQPIRKEPSASKGAMGAEHSTKQPNVTKPERTNPPSAKASKPAPATPAPATPAPATPAPATPAPVTPAPVTPAPVTPAPVTPAPVTPAPVTPAPVTQAPVTQAPVTPAPVTPAPVTPAPVTPAPVTPAPVTPAPVTQAPVTQAPVTQAPVTQAPVTQAPVTPAPVTPAPVTPAPVTPAPVTPAPVTPAPVTQAPVLPAVNRSTKMPAEAPAQDLVKDGKAPEKSVKTASSAKSQSTKKGASKSQSTKKADSLTGKRKKQKPAWFLPVLGLGSLGLLGILVAVLTSLGGGATKTEPVPKVVNVPGRESSSSNDTATKKPTDEKPAIIDPIDEFFAVQPDDGKSLWAPPSVGPAYSVELLPPGVGLIAVFSEGVWTGQKTGPIQEWMIESVPTWKTLVANYPQVDQEQIKRVTVAVYPGTTPTSSEMILKMELNTPAVIKDYLTRHATYKEQKIPGAETDLYCWSNGAQSMVFDGFTKDVERKTATITIGPNRIINTFAETSGGVAPLSRQLESLLNVSNSEADLFVLTTPSFINGNGREIYASSPRFKDVFRSAVDDTIQAFSVSLSLKDNFYVEGRMITNDIAKSGGILSKLRDTLDGLANNLETQFAANPAAAYWRLIASRYPQMIRSVAKNTRMGIEEGQIVLNFYQPRESVANLAIGTWMVLQNAGADSTQSVVMPSNKPNAAKLSIEDILNRPMSLAFAQESLEMSLAAIATEFNDSLPEGESRIEMSINGTAFQKEGITQNQQIRDFSFEKAPLRDLLTALVRRANPVTTVQSPKEKDQKVVWIVLQSPDAPGGRKIELTTRTWVEANSAQLPKEFLP